MYPLSKERKIRSEKSFDGKLPLSVKLKKVKAAITHFFTLIEEFQDTHSYL